MCFWKKDKTTKTVDDLAELCPTPEKLAAWLRRNITYVSDQAQFGEKEKWLSPKETLEYRKGDCEDFAILAQAVLRRQGYVAGLLAVYGWNGYRRNKIRGHMVCAFLYKGMFWHIGNWRMRKCGKALIDVADQVFDNAKICRKYKADRTIEKEWVRVQDTWRVT